MKTFFRIDDRGLLLHPQHVYPRPSGSCSRPFGTVEPTPPAAPAGYVCRWESSVDRGALDFGAPGTGQWIVEADYRKASLFLTADGQAYTFDSDIGGQSYPGTGPLPEWLTDQERPSRFHHWDGGTWILDEQEQLADAKSRKLLEIDQARDAALAGGFEYGGNVYDSDQKSIQRISAIATLALMDPEFSTPYITADNSVVTLDASAVGGLGAAAAAHEAALVFHARALKDQVLSATTLSEVEAIVWTAPASA